MNKTWKIIIVVILVLAVGAVLAIKHNKQAAINQELINYQLKKTRGALKDSFQREQAIPRLVDLGADKCIPCKMMAPMLEELREEYKGRLEVTFIDVWKNPSAGRQYGIRAIPTQIFFDASGRELYRHEGFFSKKDILAKWQELGIKFQ